MLKFIARNAMLPVILAALVGLCVPAGPAQAQLARTFVSAAGGNDANDCSRATPCRTFQAAHDKTFDQGEVSVLDPGGYGALTITKSISVVNDGVGEAGIAVSGGAAGITVDAPAGAYINLRGLTVQGIGFGSGTGLWFKGGFALTITNCVISNHTGNGVEFIPNTASRLSVSNTLIADNGINGIHVAPGSSGSVKATFNRIESYNNGVSGLSLPSGRISASVVSSVTANNKYGLFVGAVAGYPASLMVARSVVANNDTGLRAAASASATLWVGQSTIAGNAISWASFGGAVVQSFGDNVIAGNGDSDHAPPTIPRK